MSTLLDPVILDTLFRAGKSADHFGNISVNIPKIIINIIIPALVFLFMAIFVKLKWDKKHNKNNYTML